MFISTTRTTQCCLKWCETLCVLYARKSLYTPNDVEFHFFFFYSRIVLWKSSKSFSSDMYFYFYFFYFWLHLNNYVYNGTKRTWKSERVRGVNELKKKEKLLLLTIFYKRMPTHRDNKVYFLLLQFLDFF